MNPAPPPFLSHLASADPELHSVVAAEHDLVMSATGSLGRKQTMLILLAVDAFAGSSGVGPISGACRKAGASDVEIAEALRVAHLVAGNRVLATAAAAFEGARQAP